MTNQTTEDKARVLVIAADWVEGDIEVVGLFETPKEANAVAVDLDSKYSCWRFETFTLPAAGVISPLFPLGEQNKP